jgi:hypothetical protein
VPLHARAGLFLSVRAITDGSKSVQLIIGNQRLDGKIHELKQPLAVMSKVEHEDKSQVKPETSTPKVEDKAKPETSDGGNVYDLYACIHTHTHTHTHIHTRTHNVYKICQV